MRRAARLLAVTALALTLTAAPASAQSPINPANKPTPVPDRGNGRLHPEDLITVVPGSCLAYRPAASSLHLLLAAARAEGVDLGTSECYRPLDNQYTERQRYGVCAAPPGTSMHGWGKAVDFRDSRGGLTYASPALAWLKAHAADYGWNWPGWAQPNGSGCDEPWHWEWVGDGGVMQADRIDAVATTLLTGRSAGGPWTVDGLGTVIGYPIGIPTYGGTGDWTINRVIVGGAATSDGGGYWLVGADGGVFAFGNARFMGGMGGTRLNAPIVGMAASPTDHGYWLVAADGGIFNFGDAPFAGSMGGQPVNRPIMAMAANPHGPGYWLVASDGGVFGFGGAPFLGGMGGTPINRPIVGMAANPKGSGYWLAAIDGGVFNFGGAPFLGSAGGQALPPTQAIAAVKDGYALMTASRGLEIFQP